MRFIVPRFTRKRAAASSVIFHLFIPAPHSQRSPSSASAVLLCKKSIFSFEFIHLNEQIIMINYIWWMIATLALLLSKWKYTIFYKQQASNHHILFIHIARYIVKIASENGIFVSSVSNLSRCLHGGKCFPRDLKSKFEAWNENNRLRRIFRFEEHHLLLSFRLRSFGVSTKNVYE